MYQPYRITLKQLHNDKTKQKLLHNKCEVAHTLLNFFETLTCWKLEENLWCLVCIPQHHPTTQIHALHVSSQVFFTNYLNQSILHVE